MTRRIPLDINQLSELLIVDTASPSGLKWIKKPSRFSPIHVGSSAGSIGSEGYYRIKIKEKTYLNHRIVVYDTWEEVHAALTRIVEAELNTVRLRLQHLQGIAGNVRGMKPPVGEVQP